jgi:hypothetical protein
MCIYPCVSASVVPSCLHELAYFAATRGIYITPPLGHKSSYLPRDSAGDGEMYNGLEWSISRIQGGSFHFGKVISRDEHCTNTTTLDR